MTTRPARTYLGMPARTAAAWTAAAAITGAAIGLALPTPLERHAPCGVVAEVEDGVTTYLPASCMTAAEMRARLDAVLADRGGNRFGDR